MAQGVIGRQHIFVGQPFPWIDLAITQKASCDASHCSGVGSIADTRRDSPNRRYVKSFVEAIGATSLRPDLPAFSCECYRRRPAHGSQLALCAAYGYHGCITYRDGDNTLELEANHRRHAEIENVIQDLKYGLRLNYLPSGRFAANIAWLAIQFLAHNLARWTARIGVDEVVVTIKTLRRFFSLTGRLTCSARRLTRHLPQRCPWETQFSRALARLRTLPLPA